MQRSSFKIKTNSFSLLFKLYPPAQNKGYDHGVSYLTHNIFIDWLA